MDGLLNFSYCFYGRCQFSKETGVWATEKRGIMPAPNFGERVSQGRFRRRMRYMSEGPESAPSSDPWREIRWLVNGYNENRRNTTTPSWLVVVDETVRVWTGQGIPRLSFVPRKPEPLGAD